MVECHLICSSSSQHLNQYYGGFGMLAKRGLVKFTVSRADPFQLGPFVHPKLEVVLNGKLRLVFDAYDGPNFLETPLAECDVYFKRSYQARLAAAHEHGHKILPLGLNYIVYGPGDFWLKRALWTLPRRRYLRQAVRQFIRASGLLSKLFKFPNGRNDCRVEKFEADPKIKSQPRVLLLTQTWDPAQVAGQPDRVEDRHCMNQMRAACIQALRQAFGKQFTGGFSPSRYAREHFPESVAEDPRQTRKEAFVRLVHESDVCVTTLGLQSSNGFRLAEYTAAARAIVTERMRHLVPGDFEAGQNYVDFTTPEECVAAVGVLLADPAQRLEMMRRNQAYYRAYVRPDALVWNSLQTASRHFPS
jgi:hypothetical protein